MKTKKKNRFLTFCFSCLPGAAEMYMGFMKMGLSLMLVLFAIIIIGAWINQGILSALGVVVWFYSFFHANHLASLSDEDFVQVEDQYLMGMDALPEMKILFEKYHNLLAYGLIFVGACCLWGSVADLLNDLLPEQYDFIVRIMWRIGDYVPSVLIGIVVIVVGIKMIKGKKVEQDEKGE